jgi:pSer/pThr/pTyr-binding forkhead associated (FHA) protein
MSGHELTLDDLEGAPPEQPDRPPRPGQTRVAAGALLRRVLGGDGARAGPHLLIRAPGCGERVVALDAELTVGRDPAAGLQLDDPGSSRRHACFRLGASGELTVEDLGSKNGLRINGRRLDQGPAALRPGDAVTLGQTSLRYLDPLAAVEAGPTPTAEATEGPWRQGADRGLRRLLGGRTPPAWRLLACGAGLLAAAAVMLALGQ